ncbi:MAG: hypothetical protein WDN46_22980 [Methylocella sp.]
MSVMVDRIAKAWRDEAQLWFWYFDHAAETHKAVRMSEPGLPTNRERFTPETHKLQALPSNHDEASVIYKALLGAACGLAVLEAMTKPTTMMVDAGDERATDHISDSAADIWTAMIEKAKQ